MKGQNIAKAIMTFVCLIVIALGVLAQQAWKVGDQVEVKYGGRWWAASILEVGRGQYKIRYDGYNSSWDEWKTPADIRPRANAGKNNADTPPIATAPATASANVKAGDWVLANKGATTWHAARLLGTEQNQYKVRYHGDPATSYFLVPPDRIRSMPASSVPATDASFFAGKWELSIWGGVQETVRGGKVYREFDYAAAKVPPLTIKGDGSYEWIVPANGGRKVITGRWRNVSAAEWRYDSVAIMLLNGMDGKNWIVYENITDCTPKFVGEKMNWCTPDKVTDKIRLWEGNLNYDGSRLK